MRKELVTYFLSSPRQKEIAFVSGSERLSRPKLADRILKINLLISLTLILCQASERFLLEPRFVQYANGPGSFVVVFPWVGH
jgi:hypothetical protein